MHNYSLIRLKEVDSTNVWAKKAFHEKIVGSGAAIVAATQQEGRGQMRTKWHDEKGKNILLTLIVDTQKLHATHFFRLNEAVSLALIDVLESYTSPLIKWPNDIWVENKKIAGILIETILQGNFIKTAFVGIGLNVNQKKFPDDLNATSVANETGFEMDLNKMLENLLNALAFRISQLHMQNVLAKQYFAHLLGTQNYLKYKDEDGTFYAKVHKIEDDGRLVLQLKDEAVIQHYQFKEVQLLGD